MQIKRGKWMGKFVQGFHVVVNPRKFNKRIIRTWLRSIYETSFRMIIGETWSTKGSLREMVSERPSMRDSWRRILYKGYDSKDDLHGILTEGWRKIERRFEVMEASFRFAAYVSVFWGYLEIHVSDLAESFWVGKIASRATIHIKTISSDSAFIKEEKEKKKSDGSEIDEG